MRGSFMSVRVLIGDAREQLEKLPSSSVHCVVTSPPYWGLRAYQGDPGMIGLEPTFDEHLANLLGVFREVARVLRGDGTLWLNYGDAYTRSSGAAGASSASSSGPWKGGNVHVTRETPPGVKPKDLLMMPARVALALQSDGWWLRSEIVWHKPNPMPESVTDRPTSAHEKLYLLTKQPRYFYDAEAVRVPASCAGQVATGKRSFEGDESAVMRGPVPSHANLRNVWSIATHSFSAAHFATFPPALVEPCIRAGTSERGVCGDCGAPWVRVVERDETTGARRNPLEWRGRGRAQRMGDAGR